MKRFFAFISLATLLISSCRKDNNASKQGTTPGVQSDKLLFFSQNTSGNLAEYINSQYHLQADYFGQFDPSGNISKLQFITLKTQTGDTLINYSLNDSLKIEYLFATINGVNDTTLLRFNYCRTDSSLTTLLDYHIDWTSNTKTLRRAIIFKRTNGQYSVSGVIQNSTVINNPINEHIRTLGTTPLSSGTVLNVGENTDPEQFIIHTAPLSIATANQIIISGAKQAGSSALGKPGTIIPAITGMAMALKPADTSDPIADAPLSDSAKRASAPALHQASSSVYSPTDLLTMHGWKYVEGRDFGSQTYGFPTNYSLVYFNANGTMPTSDSCNCYLGTDVQWTWDASGHLLTYSPYTTSPGSFIDAFWNIEVLTEDILLIEANSDSGGVWGGGITIEGLYVAP